MREHVALLCFCIGVLIASVLWENCHVDMFMTFSVVCLSISLVLWVMEKMDRRRLRRLLDENERPEEIN